MTPRSTLLLLLAPTTLAWVAPLRQKSRSLLRHAEPPASDETNPFADPNYPQLEFIDYSNPDYQSDRGQEFYEAQLGDDEAAIEAMREERRRRNDEFQFQKYYRDLLQAGAAFHGEWTIYQTSTFVENNNAPPSEAWPRLLQAKRTIPVLSRGVKIAVDVDSPHPTDRERIVHQEALSDDVVDPEKVWREDIDTDSGFGRNKEPEETPVSPQAKAVEEQILSYRYCPEELSSLDFRGSQGIMCVGNAYTLSAATAIHEAKAGGPYSTYRTEVGMQSKQMRFRVRLNYRILPKEAKHKAPPLHLESLVVCRETKDRWPKVGKSRTVADKAVADALFGAPGAEGGLYDPPPVGSEEQAGQYMMLDLEGRATLLFPYIMDQDEDKHDGNGWVVSLDWTPGSNRYQVDRKVEGGPNLLTLRTLELSEVQSVDAEQYRPRDGGANMRQ